MRGGKGWGDRGKGTERGERGMCIYCFGDSWEVIFRTCGIVNGGMVSPPGVFYSKEWVN